MFRRQNTSSPYTVIIYLMLDAIGSLSQAFNINIREAQKFRTVSFDKTFRRNGMFCSTFFLTRVNHHNQVLQHLYSRVPKISHVSRLFLFIGFSLSVSYKRIWRYATTFIFPQLRVDKVSLCLFSAKNRLSSHYST